MTIVETFGAEVGSYSYEHTYRTGAIQSEVHLQFELNPFGQTWDMYFRPEITSGANSGGSFDSLTDYDATLYLPRILFEDMRDVVQTESPVYVYSSNVTFNFSGNPFLFPNQTKTVGMNYISVSTGSYKEDTGERPGEGDADTTP